MIDSENIEKLRKPVRNIEIGKKADGRYILYELTVHAIASCFSHLEKKRNKHSHEVSMFCLNFAYVAITSEQHA